MFKNVLKVLFVISLTVAIYIMNGAILQLEWKWFVVPNFNTHELSLASALGLTVMITFLTLHQVIDQYQEYGPFRKSLAVAFQAVMVGLASLVVSFIVQMFV